MNLTVYIHTNHPILRKCIEVFIKTYFNKRFDVIDFKLLNNINESIEKDTVNDISGVLKYSFQSLRNMHESLKLKEKHDVWICYVNSFNLSDLNTNKNCSVILLNSSVGNYRAKCQIFKGELNCINDKTHDLDKTKLLNENLKKLFQKASNVVKY